MLFPMKRSSNCLRVSAVLLRWERGLQEKERENPVVIHLLAIAIFGAWTDALEWHPLMAHVVEKIPLAHTMNEGEAQNSLFIYEPELVAHIAELIHPNRNISVDIQTAVVATLDGLSRYRSKTGEVLAAVNAGATHGTLMGLMWRTITHLTDPNCAPVSTPLRKLLNDSLNLHAASITTDFAESLFSFVTFLSSSPAGGSMIVERASSRYSCNSCRTDCHLVSR